jgi:hypothetical protein
MANELTVNASLAYEDSEGSDVSLAVADDLVNVSTKKFIKAKQNIGTTEEAIGLGEVTSLGWAMFKNCDATNYIEIKTGTGGTVIMKLLAGECAMFRFGSGITAPYAIANVACQMEYLIVST